MTANGEKKKIKWQKYILAYKTGPTYKIANKQCNSEYIMKNSTQDCQLAGSCWLQRREVVCFIMCEERFQDHSGAKTTPN